MYEDNYIVKFESRCHEFDSDFVPLALETFDGTSEKFDKLLEKLSSKAAESTISPTLFCLITGRKESPLASNGNVYYHMFPLSPG